MGIEYKIRIAPAKVATFDGFLRQARFFESFDEEHQLYNLRLSGAGKSWDGPDACAALDEDGIYFLDNLSASGETAQIFRALVDEALKQSDPITITEP